MRSTRHLIAAAVLGTLAIGAALPASAHDRGGWGGDGWGEHYRHPHHHDRYRHGGPAYYGPAPVYAAPQVVYERPIVYAPPPVYAYPARPAITIGLPSVVIPLR